MSFPKYPKYKDSGAEWLGEVPEHWESLSLRRLVSSVQTGGTPSPESLEENIEQGLVWYTPGDFGDSLRLSTSARKLVSNAITTGAVKLFPPRSVLIVSICASLGKVGFAESSSSANQQINAVIPNEKIDGYFLAYPLSVKTDVMRFLSNASTIGTMNQEKTKDISLAVPSRNEQSSIATFLDRETSKIDTLVGEQRRLIELLKEKRQAVISHAVTKGLNPNAPLKPSGIEWLGDVPEHWDVKPMRMIASVMRGASPCPAGDPRYFGGDAVPWVTVAEITKDDIVDLTETESFLTEEGAQNSKMFPMGTVIYPNSGATLGVPKILQINACANDGVVAFEKLSREVHPQFLYHYLASITDAIREKVKQGSGQPNLNTDIVKALRFGLPPMNEQERIVGHITKLAEQLGSLTAEAERGIELLQERRTALISAAVTGKIDVRRIAPSIT